MGDVVGATSVSTGDSSAGLGGMNGVVLNEYSATGSTPACPSDALAGLSRPLLSLSGERGGVVGRERAPPPNSTPAMLLRSMLPADRRGAPPRLSRNEAVVVRSGSLSRRGRLPPPLRRGASLLLAAAAAAAAVEPGEYTAVGVAVARAVLRSKSSRTLLVEPWGDLDGWGSGTSSPWCASSVASISRSSPTSPTTPSTCLLISTRRFWIVCSVSSLASSSHGSIDGL